MAPASLSALGHQRVFDLLGGVPLLGSPTDLRSRRGFLEEGRLAFALRLLDLLEDRVGIWRENGARYNGVVRFDALPEVVAIAADG